MIKEQLSFNHRDSYQVMVHMLSGNATLQEIHGFLERAQITKKDTNQLVSYLQAIRDTAKIVINSRDHDLPVVDLSGTGGDQQKTINISTLAALVAASTKNVFVYKYGNRSATGICGSMDVLDSIGINIDLEQTSIDALREATNFIPLFARNVYPGARHVAEARKLFAKPSIFNFLFPLARPIKGPHAFVMGFANPREMEIAAGIVQAENGSGLLVRGQDGTDEISVSNSGLTDYYLIHQGEVRKGVINSRELFEVDPIELSLLQISTRDEAIESFQLALDPRINDRRIAAIRTSVLANAAAALAISQSADIDLSERLHSSFKTTKEALLGGEALRLLGHLQSVNSNRG